MHVVCGSYIDSMVRHCSAESDVCAFPLVNLLSGYTPPFPDMIQYLLCLLCTQHKRARCLQSAYHSGYVVCIPHCYFLPSILLSEHVLIEFSVGSWLTGTYSADYSLLCVAVVSMLMNTAPTTTILSCAPATTGPC